MALPRLGALLPAMLVGAVGAGAILGARDFPAPPGQVWGPALFPTLMGAGLILCALFIARGGAPGAAREPDAPGGRLAAVLYALAPAAVLLLFDTAGWPLLCFVLVTVLSMLVGARPWVAALVGLGMAIFTWAAFAMLLRVPLPRGPLPFLPY